MTIRVAIADDHLVVRQGLKRIFEDVSGYQVVGEAANAAEALHLARSGNIDVLILDMSMPGRSGIELIREIKAEKPKLAVLVLSMHNEEQYAVRSIKAGAAGYLTKGSAAEELVSAVGKVARGSHYITPEVAERLALEFDATQEVAPHKLLSDREFEIMKLIVAGRKIGDIAVELSLSDKTVSTYKARILQKMGMKSSAELIHYAIRHGLSAEGLQT